MIKNGVIGLTSHMGIFAIDTSNTRILNVHIRDFETHGMVLDQFTDLIMKDVEIGPSMNGQLSLNTRYTVARYDMSLLFDFYAV